MSDLSQSGISGTASFRFFFSYSWKNGGRPLTRFFNDLSEAVRKLVGGTIETVAFRDRVTMKAGTEWSIKLLEAVQSSQVLVYLHSADYVKSDYCGKEFQVFRERLEAVRSQNPGAEIPLFIQPVIWVPLYTELPAALQFLQPSDDVYGEEYAKRGLESLAKQRSRSIYDRIVEELATRIVSAGKGDRLPRIRKYTNFDDIDNAFRVDDPVSHDGNDPAPDQDVQPQKPVGVRCIYLAPKPQQLREVRRNTRSYSQAGGWHWRPFDPPVSERIGSLVQQLLFAELEYVDLTRSDDDSAEIDFDALVRKVEAAARNDQVILLILDAWCSYLQDYQRFLQRFDKAAPITKTAILVPWNESDADTAARAQELQNLLRVYLEDKYLGLHPSPFFKTQVTKVEELREVLPAFVNQIRIGIENLRATRKVVESARSAPQVRSSRTEP